MNKKILTIIVVIVIAILGAVGTIAYQTLNLGNSQSGNIVTVTYSCKAYTAPPLGGPEGTSIYDYSCNAYVVEDYITVYYSIESTYNVTIKEGNFYLQHGNDQNIKCNCPSDSLIPLTAGQKVQQYGGQPQLSFIASGSALDYHLLYNGTDVNFVFKNTTQ